MRWTLGWLVGLLLLGALAPGTTRAQAEIAGRVKTVSGEAWMVGADGARTALEVGSPVASGDSIETGEDGSVGITFRDETRISIGPGSQVAIDEFLFAPDAGELGFAARIARGTLYYVSGAIARLAPEKVTVATPEGTVGIRGTAFVVRVGARPERRWR